MLLPEARRAVILKEVALRGAIRSLDLARRMGVSEVTIRRDIVHLDAEGLLERVHGGAVRPRGGRPTEAAGTLVGVLVPADTPNFSESVRGMERAAPALGVRLVLGVTHYSESMEKDRARRLLGLGVEGLVVAPVVRDRSESDLAEWLGSLGVPLVLFERHLSAVALRMHDHVRTDHRHGVALALEHFVALGHRSVALASYDLTPTAPSVRAGWLDAVARLGLTSAPYAALPKGEENLRPALSALVEQCRESGTRAVLVHTDFHAMHLVEALQDAGLRVPQDMAVIAYDDNFAALAPVPLTAISTPRDALGEQAVRLVLERVRVSVEGSVPTPRHVELLPTLRVRSSCGADRA